MQQPSFARYRALLGTYLAPQRGKVAALAALVLAYLGLQLAGPLIVRSFIDTAIAHGSLDSLLATALAYMVVAICTQAVAVAEAYMAEDVSWTATNMLRVDVAAHCLDLDLSFHHGRTPGELIERIDGDADLLANFFSRFVIAVLGNALLLIGVLAVLFSIDWRIGLTLLLYSICGFAVLSRMRGLALPHWKVFRQIFAELFGFIGEWLAGADDVRANGATPYPLRLLSERFRAYMRPQRTATVLLRAIEAVQNLLLAVGTVLAFLLTAYLFTHHAIGVGTAYLIVNYTQQLAAPLRQISGQFDDVQQATAGMLRLEELLAMRSALSDGQYTPPAGALSVEFRRVWFAYGAEPVLRDVSFTVKPGRAVGILGRTGSGKTSLTRLLFRFYDPTEGAVLLGGQDLRDLSLADLRGRVGLVTQEVQLFGAGVRDNLTFFDRTVEDGRILAALDELGLAEWYRALPNGLDTVLAPGGVGLSAGQAQLLALVRAFLADPSVVILDEASSRLDPATERRLDRAIDRLLLGRTALIIAHRLSTIARADDILILEDGQIIEHGPRAQLAASPGSRFAQLLQAERQTMGEPRGRIP